MIYVRLPRASARDPVKVQELSADPVVGTKLDRIIQRAQFMLYGIRPDSPFAHKAKVMPWLLAGYGSLPEDKQQGKIQHSHSSLMA